MTENKSRIIDYWNSADAAKYYEAGTGGVTKAVTKDILALYLKSNSLDGKIVLDNACGPGIVTKELLTHTSNITIEAADFSGSMIDQFHRYLASQPPSNAKITAKVMDAEELTYPDATFDLTLTIMGLMFLPNPRKGLEQLYRISKPGAKCYVTTWYHMETFDIGKRLIKRLRGEEGDFDFPVKLWMPEMEDPKYLVSEFEKVGFKECGSQTTEKHVHYPEPNAIDVAMTFMPVAYQRFLTFKDEEEKERWFQLWREEFKKNNTGEGIKIKMWPIYVWGTK